MDEEKVWKLLPESPSKKEVDRVVATLVEKRVNSSTQPANDLPVFDNAGSLQGAPPQCGRIVEEDSSGTKKRVSNLITRI